MWSGAVVLLQVLSYFREYSPVYCEWLDDSSCNILFRDEFTAKRAIFGMGKPLPPEDIPEGQGTQSDAKQCTGFSGVVVSNGFLHHTGGQLSGCVPMRIAANGDPRSGCACAAELAVVDVMQLEKLWHKGPDFEKDGRPIPLIFRVATVS